MDRSLAEMTERRDRLAEKVGTLALGLAQSNERLAALRADRDRLREALEPFADLRLPDENVGTFRLHHDDIADARTALAQSKEAGA